MTNPLPQAGLTPEELKTLYKELDALESLSPQEQMQSPAEIQAKVAKLNAQIDRMSLEQKQEFQKKQLAKSPVVQPLDVLFMMEGSLIRDFQAVSQRVAAEQKNKTLSLADQIAAMNAKANTAKAIVELQGAIDQETQREEAQRRAAQPSAPNSGQYL